MKDWLEEYREGINALAQYGSFECADGRISFLGILRVNEEGRSVFRIDLLGRLPMFGEWSPCFSGDMFWSAEIISFGFRDPFQIDSRRSDARDRFSQTEVCSIKNLISNLFSNAERNNGVSPFGVEQLTFNRRVSFHRDWVLKTGSAL